MKSPANVAIAGTLKNTVSSVIVIIGQVSLGQPILLT
jgi:hypothetical protein